MHSSVNTWNSSETFHIFNVISLYSVITWKHLVITMNFSICFCTKVVLDYTIFRGFSHFLSNLHTQGMRDCTGVSNESGHWVTDIFIVNHSECSDFFFKCLYASMKTICLLIRSMHYPPETSSIMLMARMVAVVKQVSLRLLLALVLLGVNYLGFSSFWCVLILQVYMHKKGYKKKKQTNTDTLL